MNKIKKSIAVVAALLLMSSNVNAFASDCWGYADIKTNDWACEFEALLGVPPTHQQWYAYWVQVYDICGIFEQ